MTSIRYDNNYWPEVTYYFKNDTCDGFNFMALDADLPHFLSEMKNKKCVYYSEDKFYYSDSLKLYYTFTPFEDKVPKLTVVICTKKRPDYFGVFIPDTSKFSSSTKPPQPQTKKSAITKNTPAPKTDSYYIASGLKKLNAKNYLGSIIDNTKALQLNPLNDTAYINRAAAKIYMADSLNSAIVDLSKALALNTTRAAQVYHVRGLVKGYLLDYLGAQVDFSLALGEDDLTLDLQITCYIDRAQVCISLKNYPQAIADCGSAIELDPTSAIAYNLQGNARALNDDLDGACVDWYLAKDLGSADAVKSFKTFCK